MHPFALSTATDIDQAVTVHASDPGVAFVAGGTDLLGLMKDRAFQPPRLLDINHLEGLDRVERLADGGIRLGALVRMSDLAADMHVRRTAPLISESLLFSASGQLRNMASMGGNIMQRTRCAYFRDGDGTPCNKRTAGSGCSARHGLNRNHAIFGWSDACVAVHPSDVAVALSALDANVRVRNRRSERTVPINDFYVLPGDTGVKDNILGRGDLIVGIDIPYRSEARRSHYLKVRDRQSYEFALVSVAVGLDIADHRIRSARIAMGGVAHKPWRLSNSEKQLSGADIRDAIGLRKAIASSFGDARSLDNNGFKIELAQRAVLRAVQTAGSRA